MIYRLKQFLARILRKIGKIERNAHFNKLKRLGLLEVGRHSYGTPEIDVYRNSERKVIIGNFCSISKNVRIITGGIHPVDWVSTYPIRDFLNVPIPYDGLPTSKGDVIIGHDVWIGTGATILSGVTIGTGAIISSCAVVTKDVPPYSLVGGVPAKVIRFRFSQEQINMLMETKWWLWDDDKIRSNIHLLSSDRIGDFLKEHGNTKK